MNAPLPDQLLEEEIRAMLQRRAQDVNPQPPPWRELAQRNGAVVISLRTGARVATDADRRRRRSRQWFRPVLAAAVALILAMVGALLVQGSGPNNGDSADGPEPLDVPAAGQSDFDPSRATPLFPVTDDASDEIPRIDYLNDPLATTDEYLRSVGLGTAGELVTDPAALQSTTGTDDEPPITTATVAWSIRPQGLPDNPALSDGTVYLRNAERAARDTWLVVGVRTFTLQLYDIRRDGDLLSFVVDRTEEKETFENDLATVTVNEVVVGEVAIGQAQPITVVHPSGGVAVIKVQVFEDGVPMSVTSTAVPALPGGSSELPNTVPVPTAPGTTGERGIAVELEEGTIRDPKIAGREVVIVVPAEPPPLPGAEAQAERVGAGTDTVSGR